MPVYSSMQREFCDISQNQKGVLRVGAASTRGQMILPGTISLFQKSYPNIRVELTEASNSGLHQQLLKGTIDLAMADFPETLPGIRLEEFYREENVLLIEKGLFARTFGLEANENEERFRVSDFAELKRCPFVLGGIEDIDGRIGRDTLKRAGIDNPVITATSHNVGMLLHLCLCGVGACFCPKNIVMNTLTSQQVDSLWMFLLGEESSYTIRFGCQAESYQWSVIERFIECAKNVVC